MMNNKEFLQAMGFYENAGWMYNPQTKEGIFKVGCFEQMSKQLLGKIISDTAFKAGAKKERAKIQHTLEIEIKKLLTKMENDAQRQR